MVAQAWALLLLLVPAPCADALSCGIEAVESRGSTWAASGADARGLRQVVVRYAKVPAILLHVPIVGRAEGGRMLSRWERACSRTSKRRRELGGVPGWMVRQWTSATGARVGVRGRPAARCALRAYACGWQAIDEPRACDWYYRRVEEEGRAWIARNGGEKRGRSLARSARSMRRWWRGLRARAIAETAALAMAW